MNDRPDPLPGEPVYEWHLELLRREREVKIVLNAGAELRIEADAYLESLHAAQEIRERLLEAAENRIDFRERFEALRVELHWSSTSRTVGTTVFLDPPEALLKFVAAFRASEIEFLRQYIVDHLPSPVSGLETGTVGAGARDGNETSAGAVSDQGESA